MKRYTAEYHRKGHYGISICTADTIEELMEKIFNDGYTFYTGEREDILNWSKGKDKKYYGMRLTIRRGELEMTEYTSF